MKRFGRIILCLFLALSLAPWAAAEEPAAPAARKIEGTVRPCRWKIAASDTPAEEELTVYSVDGGDIPYVSLADYFPLLAEVAKAKEDWDLRYETTPGANGTFMVSRPDNDSRMVINSETDVILFPNYDLFMQQPDVSALVTVLGLPQTKKMDVGDLLSLQLKRVQEGNPLSDEEMQEMLGQSDKPQNTLFALADKAYNRSGRMVELNLRDYNIDMIVQDGVCYMPFQTLNDIFMSPLYMLFVFNGRSVIGAEAGDHFIETMYEVEPQPMSEAFAAFNFTELCFVLDYFYGLKDEHGIGSFAEMLAMNSDLFDPLTGTDSYAFDLALMKLTMGYLDDGHSGFTTPSWRSGPDAEFSGLVKSSQLGFSNLHRAAARTRLSKVRDAVWPDGVPPYEEVGDTAFVTFDTFTYTRKPEEYYTLENPDDPRDTVELILYAHRQITRENSPVKNIVLDLSLNGGGVADAAVFVTAWFTGTAIIDLVNPLSGAQSITGFMADVNLNGQFQGDPGDKVSGDYNLYCLISPYSFSCGNLVPACFRESGLVTLIGQKTGGGSCVVRPATTASGSVYQISGSKEISTVSNGSFYNADRGIEPDVSLTKAESFYDRPGLVELIHSLR